MLCFPLDIPLGTAPSNYTSNFCCLLQRTSFAAVEFLGFTRTAVEAIFKRWEERPDRERNNSTFLGYARVNAARSKVQAWKDLPPREAMTGIGIATKVQDAILNPRLAEFRWGFVSLGRRYHEN